METTINLELRDPSIYPDEKILSSVLGKSYDAYKALLDLFDLNNMTYEWRFYKDGKAWLCKVQKKKRTIVWMSAWDGFLKASLYIPVRLLDDLLELDMNETQKESILLTKNVGKSKPCTFEIREPEGLDDFEKVMLFKIKIK